MKTYVLWIEMNKSKIFEIGPNGTRSKVLRRHEIRHHTSRDPENHKNCDRFFAEIADYVADADEILLMGPSLTKDHFKGYLETHRRKGLAGKIVGARTLDLESDEKLLAESRDFFKTFDLYGQELPA